MKKILLIIAIIFLIFQMLVLAVDIDIGAPAIERPGAYSSNVYTVVNMDNPANASGTITNIEIYVVPGSTLEDVEVATFYVVSGNNLSTRDTELIGTIVGGSKQNRMVDLTVEVGDYLGFVASNSTRIYNSSSGGAGTWYSPKDVDWIPCTNQEFGVDVGWEVSLYGSSETLPDQVTGVSATDGIHTDKVVITWDEAANATGYDIWLYSSWTDVDDVTTYDHTNASPPIITAGTAFASDGTSTEHVTLSVEGEETNMFPLSYKVRAYNAVGDGAESASNNGHRGVGALTYQWQRSAGDSDDDYSNIDGATIDPYNDTEAPENGSGRYYKCVENASGAGEKTTNADRGYRIGLGITWNGILITKWNGITITIPLNTQ